MSKIFKKLVLFIVFFSAMFCVYLYYWVNSPLDIREQEVEYDLLEGSSLTQVARDLEKENIISHPKIFKLYAKLYGKYITIKAGTYVFPITITPKQVLIKLITGDILTVKVTIPEGYNIYQIAETLSENFKRTSYLQWLEAMHDKELISFIDPKLEATSLEGFLFPQTYILNPSSKPKIILREFLVEFKKNITTEMITKARRLGFNLLEYATLASIVEKETAVSSEREMVAGVFFNRLKINMRLQTDPTVIYGMWSHYKGNITKKDLLTPTPYNTYTNYGLPPGPISNPGLASFKAVLNPISNNLYFVAKGDGTHVFSTSFNEHHKAVKNYVQFIRKNKENLIQK